MDEFNGVRDLREDAPRPGEARLAASRAVLDQEMNRELNRGRARSGFRLPRPALNWRTGLAAMTAAAVVGAGVFAADSLTGDSPTGGPAVSAPQLVPAGAVLGQAASTVANRKQVAVPRPNQWLYEKSASNGPTSGNKKHRWSGVQKGEGWSRYDGKYDAHVGTEKGGPVVQGMKPDGPLVALVSKAGLEGDDRYPGDSDYLASAPTEPKALLEVIRKHAAKSKMKLESPNDKVFWEIREVLSDATFLRPELHAALYRALALLPGVTAVDGTVKDLTGRPAVAVQYQMRDKDMKNIFDGELAQQILLDPKTYEYIGERDVVTKSGELDWKGDDEMPATPFRVGESMWSSAQLDVKVMDRAGQYPDGRQLPVKRDKSKVIDMDK